MYIVIAGAGLVGSDLAVQLLEKKHDVVVIDQNKEICDTLYAETGVIAVNGPMSNIGVLREARLEKADVAVAAAGRDADNLTFAVLAKSLGVPQVIVRMKNPEYEKAFRVTGVNRIIRVTDLMVNQMIMDIEQPEVRRLTTIGGGRADVYMVDVPDGALIAGKTVREIVANPRFPDQCVIIAAYNHKTDEFVIPRGNQVIREGDELFLIAASRDIKSAAVVIGAKAAE
ncbi:MAG: TrkA family potassium uptake protein [Candidatus Krumholzibacteriota bacterium]|nr:TrkA family potassium uptake protein [Candidatus Krumholzibacteriota bacterium]